MPACCADNFILRESRCSGAPQQLPSARHGSCSQPFIISMYIQFQLIPRLDQTVYVVHQTEHIVYHIRHSDLLIDGQGYCMLVWLPVTCC